MGNNLSQLETTFVTIYTQYIFLAFVMTSAFANFIS